MLNTFLFIMFLLYKCINLLIILYVYKFLRRLRSLIPFLNAEESEVLLRQNNIEDTFARLYFELSKIDDPDVDHVILKEYILKFLKLRGLLVNEKMAYYFYYLNNNPNPRAEVFFNVINTLCKNIKARYYNIMILYNNIKTSISIFLNPFSYQFFNDCYYFSMLIGMHTGIVCLHVYGYLYVGFFGIYRLPGLPWLS